MLYSFKIIMIINDILLYIKILPSFIATPKVERAMITFNSSTPIGTRRLGSLLQQYKQKPKINDRRILNQSHIYKKNIEKLSFNGNLKSVFDASISAYAQGNLKPLILEQIKNEKARNVIIILIVHSIR